MSATEVTPSSQPCQRARRRMEPLLVEVHQLQDTVACALPNPLVVLRTSAPAALLPELISAET